MNEIKYGNGNGIFIPEVTVEMFRNASLEAVEELLSSGTMYDINLKEQTFKEYVKGWNDGRNCAFDIILNLLERIEDKNGCCQNDKIKLVIDSFRMMEKEDTDK